jgi:hypothetical protein
MGNKYTEISSENADELKILEAIFNEVYGITLRFQLIDFLENLDEAGFAICRKKSED